jgi:hypothetical protein
VKKSCSLYRVALMTVTGIMSCLPEPGVTSLAFPAGGRRSRQLRVRLSR